MNQWLWVLLYLGALVVVVFLTNAAAVWAERKPWRVWARRLSRLREGLWGSFVEHVERRRD